MRSAHPFPPLRRYLRFVLAACCVLSLTAPRGAGAAEVVLLVADRLERADLWGGGSPHLARLRKESTAGLMCTRFMLSGLPESAYVALGAGSWVQYEGSERWRGGGAPEDAAAFRVDAGGMLPPGALYCRERERVSLYSNAEARPGMLGDALHAAGKRTACIGNADLAGMPRRQILSLLMDSRGVVDLGDVGPGTQVSDGTAPGGRRVDVGAVVAAFGRVSARADVVAIEFGDTSRLAACRGDMTPSAWAQAHHTALRRLDTLVGAIRSRVDPGRTTFILLSPAPPVAPSATEQVLTPIFIAGPGWPPGLLRSVTTRRPGLAANADVPATLAALLGAGPLPDGVGAVLGVDALPDAGPRLRQLDERTRRYARERFGVFKLWLALLAPAVAVGPMLLAWRALGGRHAPVAVTAARGIQLCALSLPAAGLLAACLETVSFWEFALGLAAGVAGVSAAARLLERAAPMVPAPAWVALGTLIPLIADTTTGSWRILGGMVSYALTEGARFYGIGNEMMGIAIGLALVGLAAARPYWRGRTAVVAGALAVCLTLAIGYSGLGANFGGGLTAAFTLAVAAVCLAGWEGMRAVAPPVLALGAAGLALVGFDLVRGEQAMSHVGRAALHAQAVGVSWVAALVARKAHLNEILMGRTALLKLFLAALPVLLAVGIRQPESARVRHPGLRPLLISGVLGSVAAVLLNDSGVVAGGLMLAFVAVGVGYLGLSGWSDGVVE